MATRSRVKGVLHLAASGYCSWYQFAIEIMRATNTPVEVRPISTEEFPTPARRPAYSVMRSERLTRRPFRNGARVTKDYLSARVAA